MYARGLSIPILAVAFLVATLPAFPRSPESVEGDSPSTPPRPDTSRFRLASWIGNSVAFGIGAVLNTHYPEWLEAHDRGEALFGSYLALIFGSQTVAFALLARFPGWHFRKIPLVAGQLPLIVVLAILPRLDHPAAILATAPGSGLAWG